MAKTVVIGDGPGGLSAALFLAKNGVEVVVLGQDKTAMHYAMLHNYLGIEQIHGSDFQTIARKQVEAHGGIVREARVESVNTADGTFEVHLQDGATLTADYVILSEGKGPRIAQDIGLEYDETSGIAVDRNNQSRIDKVYVVGRSVRPGRSQAIISAGDGAAAAIDILSREAGEAVCDWDSPPKDE